MTAHDLITGVIVAVFAAGMLYVSGGLRGAEWRRTWQSVREMHGIAVEPARELARAAREARKRRAAAKAGQS